MAKSEISEWMPIEIARFYSSPRVRNMRDFQRWWYIALLMEAWQSDPPCHLSADQEQLRMIAGANQADWDKHSNLVLGCFDAVEGTNMIVNRAQLEIYNEKIANRDAKKAGGKKGADSRWQKHRLAMAMPSITNSSSSISSSAVAVDVGLKTSELVPIREVRLSIDAPSEEFYAEPYVRRVQKAFSWKPGGHAGEAAFCEAVAFESKERECSLDESAKWLTERAEMVADLIRDWPRERHKFRPRVEDFFSTSKRPYADELSNWEHTDGKQSNPERPPQRSAAELIAEREQQSRQRLADLRRSGILATHG